MAKYGALERKIARLLENFPELKKGVKYSYQYLNYLLYKKNNNVILDNRIELKEVDNSCGNFWGYYDKSPINQENILYNSFDKNKKYNVRDSKKIDIFLNYNKVSETNTWNWQQGSMLTWLDKNRFIHNLYRDGEYISKIIDTKKNEEKVIDYPIYSMSKDGNFSVSLNFSRLAKLRPDYGYFNSDYSNIEKVDFNDGIYYIDLLKNERKLIISFKTLLEFCPRKEMEEAWHKVNHIEISPNGSRVMFHHRWFDDSGRKWSRLITANVDGSGLFLLSDDDMVSHCIWKNDEEIAGWLRKKDIGDRYYLLKDRSSDYKIIGEGILTEDGHPSFSKDGKWMLTDTYPDKSRMCNLLLFNLEDTRLVRLGKFFSPFKYYGETRCDLHPRFNPCGKKLTFDSVHSETRKMYEMDITKVLESEK